jgi:TM2 domain-containing membrane protein YozV
MDTFLGLLQVLFIALKLMGSIGWPWWQVFLPAIVWAAFALAALAALLIMFTRN